MTERDTHDAVSDSNEIKSVLSSLSWLSVRRRELVSPTGALELSGPLCGATSSLLVLL